MKIYDTFITVFLKSLLLFYPSSLIETNAFRSSSLVKKCSKSISIIFIHYRLAKLQIVVRLTGNELTTRVDDAPPWSTRNKIVAVIVGNHLRVWIIPSVGHASRAGKPVWKVSIARKGLRYHSERKVFRSWKVAPIRNWKVLLRYLAISSLE